MTVTDVAQARGKPTKDAWVLTADTVVFGPATTVTADQLRAVGNDLTFKVHPGVDQDGLMAAAKAEILAWAAERMR
ncbi:hypothetical protein ACFPJ1_00215 [Kribbella qitaiheensis]|uniref:hypothetical protein n=1 Tax=Kribbella qitaiheensis TaxID=1544730 RepID=UPI0036151012